MRSRSASPIRTFGKKLANELGHPTVDKALREGEWVVDPSGAPALFRKLAGQRGVSSGDPFRDSREAMRVIARLHEPTSRGVKEFSPEDIEYRPQYDPWRYPDVQNEEVRYDLLRPAAPEVGSADRSVARRVTRPRSASSARRRSSCKDNRVEEVCSVVDIEGHEDIVRLKREGVEVEPVPRRTCSR